MSLLDLAAILLSSNNYPNHECLNKTTMKVREDILVKLMADPITKIIEEPGQGDINKLQQDLAEKAAKMKTTEDMVEKGRKFDFLRVVLGCQKYGMAIRNPAVWWDTLEDPRGYNKTIQAKDFSID